MKHIKARYLPLLSDTPLKKAAEMLDSEAVHNIGFSPWRQSQIEPVVRFAIAYGMDSIFLKYSVIESSPRAVYTRPNDPVYKDSCVEFFIALDTDGNYYNFEFNLFGIALVGYGSNSRDRTQLSVPLIKKIKTETVITVLNESEEPLIRWELTVMIPFDLFHFHSVKSLKGKICSANFYKCGDDLINPHFLAWSDIKAELPDFHLPAFFGKMEFCQ